MGVIRKATTILRGRPATATPDKSTPPVHVTGDRSIQDLKPALKAFLSCTSTEDPGYEKARDEIQRVADVCGPYLTGSEIVARLAILARKGELDPGALRRAHILAGSYHLQHLKKEIDTIETSGHKLGPSVFREYCIDLLDSFILGDEACEGAQAILECVELLFEKAIRSARQHDLYYSFGEEALKTSHKVLTEKFDREKKKELRAVRLHRRGDTPAPKMMDMGARADKILAYIAAYRDIHLAYLKAIGEKRIRPPEDPQGPAGSVAFIKYLYALMQVSGELKYTQAAALQGATIGSMLGVSGSGDAKPFLKNAQALFQMLARKESLVELKGLARVHTARATEIERQIQSLGATPSPI